MNPYGEITITALTPSVNYIPKRLLTKHPNAELISVDIETVNHLFHSEGQEQSMEWQILGFVLTFCFRPHISME